MDAVLQFLKLILFLTFMAVLVIIGGTAGLFVADSVFGPKAAAFANITYPSAEGVELQAYINVPPGNTIYPGILMLPDRWGLNDEMIRLANMLSNQSYVVLIPDLYRGESTDFFPRAFVLGAATPADRALSDIHNAYEYLKQLPQTSPDHIGIVGFSYGGGLALRYAAQNPDVKAAINLFGEVIIDSDALSELGGPVKGIFVNNDPLVPLEQVAAFEAALETAEVPFDVKIYDTFSTGFLKFPDIGFRNSATNTAWREEVVGFFDEHLK